jgi:hypothetical protein
LACDVAISITAFPLAICAISIGASMILYMVILL